MIEVTDLRFAYPGMADDTIRGLSFEVADGEVFGFLGPSGSGKSTTQKILIGLLQGYRGSVQVFGNDLGQRADDYHERIGVGFELPNLYGKLTAAENLAFFASMYGVPCADPLQLLLQVDMGGHADTRIRNCSKGMKMRVNFCRALINLPSLLFLDEPTGGLDPGNARRVKDLIRAQKDQGTTVFLTTHDMHVAAELCDRVAFLVDGEIALIESPHELMVSRSARTVAVEVADGGDEPVREFPLDGLADDAAFLDLLRDHPVRAIHSQEATLEDVFIEVTGRELR